MDQVKTYIARSTSSSTMDIDPIVLRENQINRLIFHPVWASDSSNPLRGKFVFQRKSPSGSWEDIPHLPLSTLKKDEGYELNLEGEEVLTLLSEFENIKKVYEQHGFSYGVTAVTVVEGNVDGIFVQITDPTKKQMIADSLQKLQQDQFEGLNEIVKRTSLDKAIKEIEDNMTNGDESFWQNFFQTHSEIFQYIISFPLVYLNGETYLGGKNTKGRQGSGGTATDFLVQNTSSGSFGVVEIKTPNAPLMGSVYRGEANTGDKNIVYKIGGEICGGIVQLEHQLQIAVEYFKTELGDDYDGLNSLCPTGFLITGSQSKLNDDQRRSFNLFRKSLGKNQIITFDEILAKLKLIRDIL